MQSIPLLILIQKKGPSRSKLQELEKKLSSTPNHGLKIDWAQCSYGMPESHDVGEFSLKKVYHVLALNSNNINMKACCIMLFHSKWGFNNHKHYTITNVKFCNFLWSPLFINLYNCTLFKLELIICKHCKNSNNAKALIMCYD